MTRPTAGERNCGDTNETTTDDDASTIAGLDEKVALTSTNIIHSAICENRQESSGSWPQREDGTVAPSLKRSIDDCPAWVFCQKPAGLTVLPDDLCGRLLVLRWGVTWICRSRRGRNRARPSVDLRRRSDGARKRNQNKNDWVWGEENAGRSECPAGCVLDLESRLWITLWGSTNAVTSTYCVCLWPRRIRTRQAIGASRNRHPSRPFLLDPREPRLSVGKTEERSSRVLRCEHLCAPTTRGCCGRETPEEADLLATLLSHPPCYLDHIPTLLSHTTHPRTHAIFFAVRSGSWVNLRRLRTRGGQDSETCCYASARKCSGGFSSTEARYKKRNSFALILRDSLPSCASLLNHRYCSEN
ncbi:hypothetical protein MRX96_016972 [Rhipicephalus microplus]